MKSVENDSFKLNKQHYIDALNQLDKDIQLYMKDNKELATNYLEMRRQFQLIRSNSFYSYIKPQTWKQFIRTTGAYILGRRNIKRLYSTTYKNKQASNDLKPILASLYEAGIEDKSLQDLKEMYWNNSNQYQKRATAWELLFWYANKQTKVAAQQALLYFFDALYGERDEQVFCQKCIVIAECFQGLEMYNQAKQILQLVVGTKDANVYLAKANIQQEWSQKLHYINKALSLYRLEPIVLTSEYSIPYKNLQVELDVEVTEGPLVSIIMPAYNAEEYIDTAIQSLLKQTWKNIEIIIVDDCSTDRTFEIIQQFETTYKQIKVFQTPKNSGAYVARNIGLRAAKGEFVTINDADDWSHPRKIEIQMNHLKANPQVIANTSELSRITENLHIYRRGTKGKFIFSNMSSLLFKKKEVLESIGYWDKVRFAGDGEFKRRLIRYFGKDKIIDLKTGPLSFPLQSETSLTANSAFGYHGAFVGARKEYVESFEHYYASTDNLYYSDDQVGRPFPVPYPMLMDRKKGDRFIDVIMIDDFYNMTEDQVTTLIRDINIHQSLGLKTGLVQMYATYPVNQNRMHEKVRALIDGEEVQMVVYGETIYSYVQMTRNCLTLQHIQQFLPKIHSIGSIVLIDEIVQKRYNKESINFRTLRNNHIKYYNKVGLWYFKNEQIKQQCMNNSKINITTIPTSVDYWIDDTDYTHHYIQRLKRWILDM